MKNFLDNWRRQRDANRLAGGMEGTQEYMRRKAMVDNAPVGAVGAPSGIAEHQNALGGDALTNLGALGSFAPVIGDAVGLATDARYLYMNPEERTPLNYGLTAMGALPFVPAMSAMTAFHGSPHKFDVFDMKKVGTGEGAQAYGHGLYFAENPGVAKQYQRLAAEQSYMPLKQQLKEQGLDWPGYDIAEELIQNGGDVVEARAGLARWKKNALSDGDHATARELDAVIKSVDDAIQRGFKNADIPQGNFYEVDIPDESIDNMLDWDAPLSEQPANVQRAIKELNPEYRKFFEKSNIEGYAPKAGEAYSSLAEHIGKSGHTQGDAFLSEELKYLGIPGIKYYDGGSRAAGEGTRNFVVFDDKLPTMLKRNDEPINALSGIKQ